MSALLIYSIKSVFVLALLYVPYTLMLHRESFFRFNRFTLLAILVLSLVLPLCNFHFLAEDGRVKPPLCRPQKGHFLRSLPTAQHFVALFHRSQPPRGRESHAGCNFQLSIVNCHLSPINYQRVL